MSVPWRGMRRMRGGRYCPYAAVTQRSGARPASWCENSSVRALSGHSTWRASRPAASAADVTGDGDSVRRRPCGRAGWLTTPTTATLHERGAASRRDSTCAATDGVPKNTTRRGEGRGSEPGGAGEEDEKGAHADAEGLGLLPLATEPCRRRLARKGDTLMLHPRRPLALLKSYNKLDTHGNRAVKTGWQRRRVQQGWTAGPASAMRPTPRTSALPLDPNARS